MNSVVISQSKQLSPFFHEPRSSEPRRLWMQQRGFGGRWVGASLAALHHLARYKGEGGIGRGGGHGGANCEVWRDCAPAHSGASMATCLSAVLRPTAVTPGVTETQPKAQKTKKSSAKEKRNKFRLHAVKQDAKEMLRQYLAFRGRRRRDKNLWHPQSPPKRQRGDKGRWRQATEEIVGRCQVNHSGTITDSHSTL